MKRTKAHTALGWNGARQNARLEQSSEEVPEIRHSMLNREVYPVQRRLSAIVHSMSWCSRHMMGPTKKPPNGMYPRRVGWD